MKSQLTIYDALVNVNVPHEKAMAVAEALESDMNNLVTKADLVAGLDSLAQKLTIRLGGMLAAAVGVLAAIRFFG